jgi:RNA polymerase sigma factor (sigma-70 family)
VHATMDVPAAAPRAPLRSPRPRIPRRLLRLAGDDRLVEQVRAGSAVSFEVVFERHHRGVLAFCRHMLGSVEEAEDAVQHTFMAAYRDLAASTKPVHLRPWLYAIARNRCVSLLRARREQPVAEVAEPETEHLTVQVQRREDLRELLRDIARLSDDQRAALVLSEIGDLSHGEIARILGCEREKVKALVFQARTSLNASRAARDTSCFQIRQQLANLRGGALRRNVLRRHLRDCSECREFRHQMREQRRALALVLPVAPSVGLKGAVLGSAVGGGGAAAGGAVVAAGGAATTGTLSTGGGTFAAKALVAAAVCGGGATAGVRAFEEPAAAPPPEAVSVLPPAGDPPPAMHVVAVADEPEHRELVAFAAPPAAPAPTPTPTPEPVATPEPAPQPHAPRRAHEHAPPPHAGAGIPLAPAEPPPAEEPAAAPQPGPEPVATPAPAPEPEPVSEPAPEPQPEPEPEPEPAEPPPVDLPPGGEAPDPVTNPGEDGGGVVEPAPEEPAPPVEEAPAPVG